MKTAAKLIRDHQHLLPVNAPVPNRRILIVDDEPEIASGVARILAPPPADPPATSRSSRVSTTPTATATPPEFDVVIAHNPDEAINAVTDALRSNRPFAMGFFDVVLNAEMDGIELVQRILSVDPKMFAVFVTAYHDRTVDAIGALLGEENREKWDYINKPFTEGEILQKARNITSLWDLHRLKEWQEERLSEAHHLLGLSERQNAVAALGRSVAHEFGNILTHIVGHAELAIGKDDPAALKSALEIILKATDTASSILKRFRRIHDSDEPDSRPDAFKIETAVDEAFELLEHQFRKRYVRLNKKNIQARTMFGHKHSVIQVFVNLFINSLHAMTQGGVIHVATAESDGGVEITVRDNGPGIPEDILPKVTDPLFTTKGADGSGLGLAICKEIVEIEHQGELIVQNYPRGGVEVILRFPAKDDVEEVA